MKLPSLLLLCAALPCPAADYVIAVSEKTKGDAAWQPVLARLAAKHPGSVTVVWKEAPEEVLPALQKEKPWHTCFVAPREEATRAFVQQVHRLTRRVDDDPFTDTRWGILTGYDAENALAIASEEKTLVIHRAGSGTELAMDRIESGTWYCELRKGHMVQKDKGGEAAAGKTEPDTTKALVDLINAGPDLWVTSGHATERDWMLGFRYKNGFWKSKAGRLFGEDTTGGTWDVQSPNPKVYLPIGNCLMGHIDGPDAMALAYMKSAGVRQMAGYILPTWYGYQGWGLLDYFVEQPGRYTLTEAFHANNIALVHRLMTEFPTSENITAVDENGRAPKGPSLPHAAGKLTAQDLSGLLFDRDNVAFYGDPAWQARMAPGKLNWEQTLTEKDGTFTLNVKPLAGAATWQPVNTNGSQRGGRPIFQWLPRRIDPAKVTLNAGTELNPVIADDFLLIPLPEKSSAPLTVTFTVK